MSEGSVWEMGSAWEGAHAHVGRCDAQQRMCDAHASFINMTQSLEATPLLISHPFPRLPSQRCLGGEGRRGGGWVRVRVMSAERWGKWRWKEMARLTVMVSPP